MNKRLPLGYSYRESEGRYMCRFRYEGESYCVYGKSIEECETKKNEKRRLLEERMLMSGPQATLAQYYNVWVEEQSKTVKKSSLYHDEKLWKHIAKHLGRKKVRDITKADVIKMQNKLLETCTPETVNSVHKLLTRIMNAAIGDRIISFNPSRAVKKLKRTKDLARNTNHRALTIEEQKKFFEYASNAHYYNLYVVLINTGMRVGEATALTWKDIDFSAGTININKTVTRVSNSEYEVSDTPKTSRGSRIVPMNKASREALISQKKKAFDLGIARSDELVFFTVDGHMTNYNCVNSAIRRSLSAIEKAGGHIDHFSVHAFRDTFATRCIEQGMTPNTLKEILGHSSLKMTMDLYAHVLPNTKADELAKIAIAI